MLEYLKKFNILPLEIKQKISNPAALATISDLENKYNVNLASIVIRVMIRDIAFNNLNLVLSSELKLDTKTATALVADLRNSLFKGLEKFLGLGVTVPATPPKLLPPSGEQKTSTRGPLNIKPGVPSGKSSFFFSAEDEEEIKELTQKIGLTNNQTSSDENFKINKIIEQVGIKLSSEFLLDRFKQIISIYLRGVRDRLETKLTLTKDSAEGGMGFDESTADNILQIIASQTPGALPLKPPAKIAVPEDYLTKEQVKNISSLKQVGARDIEYDLKSLTQKKEAVSNSKPSGEKQALGDKLIHLSEAEAELDSGHELMPPPPATNSATRLPSVSGASTIKVSPPVPTRIWRDIAPKPSSKIEKTEVQKRVANDYGKKKIEDIKHVPRVMSPIDELNYLNVTNFRRLSNDPKVAVKKIIEKIKLLEAERYIKKLAGIKAWRNSPVNRLYLAIGQASISQNKPVDVIIKEWAASGKEILSIEEFEAILKLNRELRY